MAEDIQARLVSFPRNGDIDAYDGPARDLAKGSSFEYGSRAGVWRLFRVFDQAGIPATIFASAVAIGRSPATCSGRQTGPSFFSRRLAARQIPEASSR